MRRCGGRLRILYEFIIVPMPDGDSGVKMAGKDLFGP